MNAILRATAMRWLAEGRSAIVVEVYATSGSAPREAGTRMLVALDETAGTIGGGHLEWDAIAEARVALVTGDTMTHTHTIALGPSLGQCCGGVVTLRQTRLCAEALRAWPETPPRFVLQLYGAGHVGRAIVRLLTGIDCRVQWIDEREDAFTGVPLPAHIERVCVEPIEAEVRVAPAGACYLVLTHEHDLDLRITEAILRRDDFAYCGLIGSQTKRARFEHRLAARGVPAKTLARLTCPIGIPGIEGKEPEVVALAAVAQLLQVRQPETKPKTAHAAIAHA